MTEASPQRKGEIVTTKPPTGRIRVGTILLVLFWGAFFAGCVIIGMEKF